MNWTKHFTISTINKTSHHHLLAARKSKLTFINTREMWYVGKQVCCVREVWETKMHFSWVYYDILTRFFARSRTIFRNQSSLIVSKKSRWNAIRVFNLTFCMQVKKATRKRKNHTVKKNINIDTWTRETTSTATADYHSISCRDDHFKLKEREPFEGKPPVHAPRIETWFVVAEIVIEFLAFPFRI